MNIYQEFGTLKAGRPLPVKKSPTHGILLFEGAPLFVNLPFAILQAIRAQKIAIGTPKYKLKIVAVIEK